ncbi:hypothetical protein HanPI659440_Chr15g0609971 [Helianthus annuus]|nr:hypothetical protein HanHA300_Chr06g0217871 [Helianthus annuus]KAJ0694540.1 hypothetical protein HanPI659440_Chr15g0609971 [Helianthus annuus]
MFCVLLRCVCFVEFTVCMDSYHMGCIKPRVSGTSHVCPYCHIIECGEVSRMLQNVPSWICFWSLCPILISYVWRLRKRR